jgi:hypothetical protein
VDVFDRGANYDPRLDPIVGVEARRLRAQLRQYYSSVGAADTVRIDIPDCSYAPLFRTNDMTVSDSDESTEQQNAPTIRVLARMVTPRISEGLSAFLLAPTASSRSSEVSAR